MKKQKNTKIIIIALLLNLLILSYLYIYKRNIENDLIESKAKLEAELKSERELIYTLHRHIERLEEQRNILNNEVARLHNRRQDSFINETK